MPGAQDSVGHDPFGGVRAIAQEIRNNVRRATGLTCSIGVTPNKLLSKIASELDKPDGLTLLTHDDLATRIWPLPVRRINGIGPKAGAKLAGAGHPHDRRAGRLRARAGWSSTSARSYGRWLARRRARPRRPPAVDAAASRCR